MFCTKCGTQNTDGANTCTNCGNPLGAAVLPSKKPGFDPIALFKKVRATKYFIPGAIGAGALVLLLILLLVFSDSKTKPIDNMLAGIYKANVTKYIAAFPKETTEDWDKLDLTEDLLENLVDIKSTYGLNARCSYKIIEKDKYSKRELTNLQNSLEDHFGLNGDKVTEAWTITIDLTVKGAKDKETSEVSLVVIKYNGKWRLHPIHAR